MRCLISLTLLACQAVLVSAASLPDVPTVLLLGEVHDNPDGHQHRFNDLERQVKAGWRPVVAMEQFDREHQVALDEAQQRCQDADCVIQAAAGSARWDWRFYRPVISLALEYRLPLVAANLSRQDASEISRGGLSASLDPGSMAEFGLDKVVPTALLAAQRDEIIVGHCNKLPLAMAEGMALAQIARDIWMAKSLMCHAPRGAVLIAGNGHVRRDIGVPSWLRQQGVTAIRSVGYVEEVKDGSFDETVVVARHERPDPCASFK